MNVYCMVVLHWSDVYECHEIERLAALIKTQDT